MSEDSAEAVAVAPDEADETAPETEASEATEEEVSAVVTAALSPIDGPSPTGVSVRYEDSFDAVRSEVNKISTEGPKAVDWGSVVDGSVDILEKESKDITVASYLVAGLFETEKFAGLHSGLCALNGMSREFWDDLYPEVGKIQMRVNALEWLKERLVPAVEEAPADPSDQKAIEGCIIELGQLREFLDEKLGDDAPLLGPLQKKLTAKAEALAKSAAKPSESKKKKAEPAVKGQEEPVEADLSTPAQAERALTRSMSELRRIGRVLSGSDRTDPRPYRLSRVAAWLPMMAAPNHEGGTTNFEANGASEATAVQLQGLASKQEWEQLLTAAEAQFDKSALWLDAQRFIATALQGLGPDHEAARLAVVQETSGLVGQYPELLDLKFKDGTPLASRDTKKWLASEGAAAGGGGFMEFPSFAGSVGDEDEVFQEGVEKARELVREGSVPQAAAELGNLVRAGESRRRRFLRRLELARFLEETGQHRIAISQLESLDNEVEEFRLEEWEPGLCLDMLGLYVTCQLEMMKGEWKESASVEERTERLLSRVARIDAGRAITLTLE